LACVAGPDLIIDLIEMNDVICQGTSAGVTATAKNIGDATSGQSFKVKSYVDSTAGPAFMDDWVGPLAPNASGALSDTIDTTGLSLGGHKIISIADAPADSRINESNENNNTQEREFEVRNCAGGNNPPGAFNLIDPNNNGTGVTKTPTLTWETSTDPDSDPITYYIYLCDGADCTPVYHGASAAPSYAPGTLSGNTLYAFGTNNQAASFKTTDNSLTILDKITLEISDAAVNLKNNQLIIASSDNQLYSINGNTLAKISAKMPAELQQIDKLSFFNGRLYLLDKASKNIFRLIQYGSSFSSPSVWLKKNIDVSQIASMSVDGKVVLLENNGKILILETGNQGEELRLNINPPLESPAVLFSNEKTKNMYVLDSQNKRLLVLSKNGDLINQYYSDFFNNLKDLAIDESSGNAYLLNGAKIYVINIK